MIYFNNWILPDMNYKSKKLLSEISTKNLEIIFEPKQLNTQVEGFTIYFDSKDLDVFKNVKEGYLVSFLKTEPLLYLDPDRKSKGKFIYKIDIEHYKLNNKNKFVQLNKVSNGLIET